MVHKILILVILGTLLQSGNSQEERGTVFENFTIKYFSLLGNNSFEFNELLKLNVDFKKETHLFIPGDFTENYFEDFKDYLISAYKKMKYGLVFVLFVPMKGNKDAYSVKSKLKIGGKIAEDLEALKETKDASFERIISHGRGSTVLSGVLKGLKTKPKRIVVLDAFLEILKLPPEQQITKDSAELVEVLHTSEGKNGFLDPIGHRDFYVNGGRAPQPRCTKPDSHVFCDTRSAYKYYFGSLKHEGEKTYLHKLCSDEKLFNENGCSSNPEMDLFNHQPLKEQGKFYSVVKEIPEEAQPVQASSIVGSDQKPEGVVPNQTPQEKEPRKTPQQKGPVQTPEQKGSSQAPQQKEPISNPGPTQQSEPNPQNPETEPLSQDSSDQKEAEPEQVTEMVDTNFEPFKQKHGVINIIFTKR